MYSKTNYPSPIGNLTLASDGVNLVGLWIEGQKYHGDAIFKDMVANNDLKIFDEAKKWLDRYFAGKNPIISQLQIAPLGSEFRKNVWNILCEIPYGELTTYGAIAKKIAVDAGKAQMSARAVGGAVGHNPISIIIPCHRVVGAKGNMTGYAAGTATKIKLLEMEKTGIGMMAN